MAHSSSNDKEYRLIIEKMRFSEPRVVILYGLFAIALYIILSYFGGYLCKVPIDIYIILILIFYFAFVIRGFLNKIYEYIEIGEKTKGLSPLRKLFVSDEAFIKHRSKIINKIFSKWQLYFSILFLLSFIFATAVVFHDAKTNHFSWDEIPGNDSEGLKEFLKQNFGVDWVNTAKIEKIDVNKTIIVFTENNSLSIRLNNENTTAILTINDCTTRKFIAKKENNKLNIYNTVPIWGILRTLLSFGLSWWIVIFALLSLLWALFWFIVSFIWLEDAEGLKLDESIKSFKTLINIKKYDDETLNKFLEGYYTYNRFVADSRKITELSFFIAIRVSIFAILISVNWIWALGIMQNQWQLPQISIVIFVDIIAILIFIIPHFSIHKILKSAKSETSNIINDVYELNKIHAVVRYASYSQVEESLIKNMTLLKNIVDETNSLKTWTFDLQAVIRLTATIVPTLLPYLIQQILS